LLIAYATPLTSRTDVEGDLAEVTDQVLRMFKAQGRPEKVQEWQSRLQGKGAAAARLRSKHLFTGLARCAVCGGAISVVSGGRNSPRFGCTTSWRQGVSCCPNRLTIRAKVAEPQILNKLQAEFLEPATVA
jgi:hypothetical protein